jgi:hypothetical protein
MDGSNTTENLANNVSSLSDTWDKISRKEIDLSFIDRITRKIYVDPSRLAKLEMIQYILFIVLIYYFNPFNINTSFPAFTKLLVLTISFTYVILFIFIREKINIPEDIDMVGMNEMNIIFKFFITIAFFIIFMMGVRGIIWLLMHTALLNTIRLSMSVFIFIGVLGIVYILFKKQINKRKNAPGKKLSSLILKIIMYLPCLLVDLLDYAKYEFNLTTKPVWILIGIEVVIIGMWFFVPFLFDKAINYDGLKLLNEPVNLNQEHHIGNYNDLYKRKDIDIRELASIDEIHSRRKNEKIKRDLEIKDRNSLDNAPESKYTDPNEPKNKYLAWIYKKIKNPTWLKIDFEVHPQYTDTELQQYRYKYALSGWFNLNPQPPNTNGSYGKYTNILKYGEQIALEYNGKLNSLRVMAENASNDINKKNELIQVYETKKVMYQKWNNIVINYDDGYIDVFLNGALVASTSSVVPYMSFDSVTTGAVNGLYGGICNVTYYENILTKKNIILNYKVLRGKDIPYVWSIKDDVNLNIEKNENPNNKFMNSAKNMVGVQ